jgi:hypothetical protein
MPGDIAGCRRDTGSPGSVDTERLGEGSGLVVRG